MPPVRRPRPSRRDRIRGRLLPVGLLATVIVAAVVVLVLVLTSSSPAPAGYDISYPQCPGSFPSRQIFGIVGVNGGLAHNANPCLRSELAWAEAATGRRPAAQPRLSLYLDTGNPGDEISVWPKGGRTARYGSCNGLLTNSCSYLYGEQRAEYSYGLANAVDPGAASSAPWWLDVETELSWAGTYALNIAALQGYVAGLLHAGATGPIGVYSTGAQWGELTGLNASSTTEAFGRRLPDWIAGTGLSIAEARANCRDAGFTGVPPVLAQYQVGSFDADVHCGGAR